MSRFESTAELNVRSGPGTEFEILDTLAPGDVVEEVPVAGWLAIAMDDGSLGWLSRKFLTAAPDVPEAPSPAPAAPGGEPVWLRWARSKLGQKEVPGSGDNPEILSWYHLTTLPQSMWHDATAWCAVFVNAAFLLNGIAGIKSAAAVDWLKFGQAVTTPQKGDVVVFEWAGGGHHVCFFLADAGDEIKCLGGNQSDAVTITNYPKGAVMGYRRPA